MHLEPVARETLSRYTRPLCQAETGYAVLGKTISMRASVSSAQWQSQRQGSRSTLRLQPQPRP